MTAETASVALPADEIHVWSAALDAPPWPAAVLERTLSADERRRADRYRFAADRRRFVVRRALLRLLLARYTGAEPLALAFRQGHAGKPDLARPFDATGLSFNASHTWDLALVVIARGHRVGVDVEALRALRDLDGVARTCLTAGELAALRALPAHRQNEAFLAAWTRKEAFVKATGDGLTLAPERIEVTVDPDGPAMLRAIDGDPDAASGWSLRALPTGRDHAGTVAAEGHAHRLVYRRFAASSSTVPRRVADLAVPGTEWVARAR